MSTVCASMLPEPGLRLLPFGMHIKDLVEIQTVLRYVVGGAVRFLRLPGSTDTITTP